MGNPLKIDGCSWKIPPKMDVSRKIPPNMDVSGKIPPKMDVSWKIPQKMDVSWKIPQKMDDQLFPLLRFCLLLKLAGAWSPIGDVTTTMLWIRHKISTTGSRLPRPTGGIMLELASGKRLYT